LILAVWSIAYGSKRFLFLGGLCVAGIAAFFVFQPFLIQRFEDRLAIKPIDAEYRPEFNKLRRRPGEMDDITLRIRNAGSSTWVSTSEGAFTLTYRWYDVAQLKPVRQPATYVPIPVPVHPNETVTVKANFLTPAAPGLYLLTWDISQHGNNWFSGNGVRPGLVEVDVQPGSEVQSWNGDLSRWYDPEVSRLYVANVTVTRNELWRAAVDLAREHPVFGVGPDNFRLLYGKVLSITAPNTKIRSNNLYLELLSGSGLAGLLAFAVMIGMMRRSASVAVMSLAIFLIHGFVDVFLMTTPIYFAFWILLGLAQRDYGETLPRNASTR
jgi:hypothetical protein